MMIAPKIHVSRHPTTRPPERVRAVFVEPFQIPFELGFEPVLEVVTILKTTRAESDLLLLAHPSDQLQLTFVLCAVLTFPVLIVPFPAEFLVCRPIFTLTINALKIARQRAFKHLGV